MTCFSVEAPNSNSELETGEINLNLFDLVESIVDSEDEDLLETDDVSKLSNLFIIILK